MTGRERQRGQKTPEQANAEREKMLKLEHFYDLTDGPWIVIPGRMPSVRDPHKFYILLIRPDYFHGKGELQKIVSEDYIKTVKEKTDWVSE